MRRLLPALLPATVVIALTLLPLGSALAGEAKEFKAEGVDWTLPDGWGFGPVSSSEKSAGFFAKAECSSASVEVWAYAKDTEGLSMDDRVRELTQAGGEGMGSVQATVVKDTTVSGVKGRVVVQRIKADGGAMGHFRKYVIVANGKFYQLLMRCWHDAHNSVTDEINAVRAGFRLKKGAGDKDVAEKLDEVEGGGDGKDGADGSSGSNGGGDHGDWPAKGPKREGNSIFLDNHNIHWVLPKDSAFKWTDGTDDASKQFGIFVTAAARAERKKQEFEKNTPDHNFCRMDLWLLNTRPGFKAVNWIKGGGSESFITENKFLDEVQAAKTRTKDEVKFGNIKAAYVKYEGKRGETRLVVMMFCTVLRGKAYMVMARSWGHTDAYKQMAPHVGKALRGIKFLNTQEPVRGPLLGMVPDYAADRGVDVDKEKEYTGPGYVFEKPEGLAHIKVQDSMNRDLKFVGEGRSEDGKAYIYFEIRTFKLNVSNQANPEPEKFIEKRAQDWEAGAGEGASLGGKKLKFKKGSFGKAKGLTYEFTGTLDNEPVIEEGWIVKHKSTMLWIKMQYIGKDADSKLKKVAKAIKKGMKYNR